MEDRHRADFQSLVEAVRAGTIFARNKKAHDAWRRSLNVPSAALSPERLEVAVMSLARTNPEYVVVGQ